MNNTLTFGKLCSFEKKITAKKCNPISSSINGSAQIVQTRIMLNTVNKVLVSIKKIPVACFVGDVPVRSTESLQL